SAALSLYTYMQSYPEATELGIVVHYPSDWTNPRVENPLGQDISHEVLIQNSQLIVPSGLADSVGWWKLDLDGPNYADAVSTQIQNDSDYSWSNLSVFNNGDCIRCQANFGTDTSSINNITEVDVTWYLPSGEIWSSEVLHNQNESMVTSQGAHFGPINSTVGEWLVCAFWCNGTEVGYGYSTFELYHRFTFFAHTPSFEIESDDEFTVAVILYDQDNGNPILSDAVITGNWSYLVVTFNPNLAKGWWEADFTVNDLDSGEYVIVVEVSMPYYEISSTIVTIRVPDAESLSARLVRASILGGLLVTISILGIALSRRFYKTIMSKRTIELMILEGRIDDAKNLIGLLVIHRAIGLPVYSNILKGGFQEALLSSFISAISQFRSEFSMDEPTWTAIPITEVVTAVQTDALICAIITVEAPSNRQKTQLETFSREVGGLYDHQDDTMRQMVRTPTLTDEFNSIFESYFDGQLMKRYVGVKKSLPKNLHAVSASLDTMDIDHGVTVDAIIKAAILLGFSERRAHNMVLEAVDDGHLIAAEKKLPPPIELED
ncbi:MAG: hypothetical protein PVJ05_13575, partial [Candidatus Thorarchaeota archaeon]